MRRSPACLLAAISVSSVLAQTPLTPVWRTDGFHPASGYGQALAGVGDVDGDGTVDLAVGEPFIDLDAATQISRLHFFRGGYSGPGEVWDQGYWEQENFAQLGRSVAGGDVNGDGYSDLLAGTGNRVVRAYHGSPNGPSFVPDWTVTVPDGGTFTVVASAGDVNADGFDDVVVGVPQCGRGQSREGCAYLYLGSASGLAQSASWTDESDQANAELGRSVAGVGDVDGDGFDDVVVGAPYYDLGALDHGRVYLFRGGPAGLSAAGTIDGTQAGEYLGDSIAPAGDGNGDSRADVLVGAPRRDGAVGIDQGRAVVFPGTATGISSTPIWELEGTAAGELLGQSVASIGDFDGDGFGDLAVGAPLFGLGPARVFVHRGEAGGWGASAAFVATAPDEPGCFGCAVARAGDLNGDGFSEFAVGDPSLSRAFVYSFRTTPASTVGEDGSVTPLTVSLVREEPNAWLELAWGASCAGEDDYNVYEGALGDFASHLPMACGTFHGTSLSYVTLPPGSTYYLVVPRGFGTEGSYGGGRSPSSDACAPQQIADCP